MRRSLLLILLGLILAGCSGQDEPLVLWVTGGLQGEWLPHGPYGEPPAGGLSRIARALDLYRHPGDVLVDLGRFRYPPGVAGETRLRRLRAGGFVQTLARMNYTALNVSLRDVPPWPPELASRAREYALPLVSANLGKGGLLFEPAAGADTPAGTVRILGWTGGNGEMASWLDREAAAPASGADWTILLTDAPEAELRALLERLAERGAEPDLALWLTEGQATAFEISGVPVLGMPDRGTLLGRVEIRPGAEFRLARADLSGWTDGKYWAHHPARERLLDRLRFWQRPGWRARLWEVPEALAPQKVAEAQRRQTAGEVSRLDDLEALHRDTPAGYAGPAVCLHCHASGHPRDLVRRHLAPRAEVRAYPAYERCLPCHATGFDDPAGFLAPGERPDLLAVTCEACHGGAWDHAQNGAPPFPPRPDDGVCQECHAAGKPAGHP
ncbi:MAG: hypothetical protein C4524_13490 [Candidatus Zixiibacteriota bacterium]|nr:MAG: hypothetical protein C4524_13490 [candidate division Zixibacteria bacterium]